MAVSSARWGVGLEKAMGRSPLPSPWNRGPLALLYLAALAVTILTLHAAGRGWISAVIGGLILAAVLVTLLVLFGSYRRDR